MDFSEAEIQRYSRHILLPEVGAEGQDRLRRSSVLVVGAGGLGSPVLLYLAAAGVGTVGVVDGDTLELTNLQRQIAHRTDAVGRNKAESAADNARALNPEITVRPHPERLTAANARTLLGAYDLVADGCDNFATRFLVNDACWFTGTPLVSAAVVRFDGQLATFRPDGRERPCYRCLYPAPPPAGQVPSCAEAGILGALAGVMGTLQATEVLKELLNTGDSMAGRLLIYDGLGTAFRTLKLPRDPGCPLCGDTPTYTDLGHHDHG